MVALAGSGLLACAEDAPSTSGALGSAAGDRAASGAATGGDAMPMGTGGSRPEIGGSDATAGTAPTTTGAGGTSATAGAATGGAPPVTKGSFELLVYYETRGFQHQSIASGVAMLRALAAENDFSVTESDGEMTGVANDPQITAEDLAPFDIVVFLNTTGDVFGAQGSVEREVFKNYLKEKKAFAGIHAAAETEYRFPWYEALIGEISDGHVGEFLPSGTIDVEEANENHPALAGIAGPWTRNEEWFRFNGIHTLPNVNILLRYGGGTSTTGPSIGQPLAWTRCWEGVRSFYTSLGDDSAAYDETLVRKHMLGGVLWAVRRLHAPGETCP